jgi:spoIIIJ-associated protein
MSSKIEANGTSLEEALTEAVAAVLDCDRQKVEVRVDAPGSDRFAGRIHLDLVVEMAEDGPSDPPEAIQADAPDAVAPSREAPAPAEDEDDERGPTSEAIVSPEDLDEEADAAADFLEGLLDALDLPGDLQIRVHDDHVELEVVEIGSGALIGRRGQTLEAIQELLRCSLQRQFQRRARVKVDAEGYRSRRLEKLLEKAEEAIDAVLDSGEPERLEPMDVFERKAVHHLVAEVDGLVSRSQGREPARRVVIERE